MKSRNKVLEGAYINYVVYFNSEKNKLVIQEPGLFKKNQKWSPLDKDYVKNYEVINHETYTNGTSAVIKGGLASAFLGAPGLLAGLSAKTDNIYWIAIEWYSGKRSLLEVDNPYYRTFLRQMF